MKTQWKDTPTGTDSTTSVSGVSMLVTLDVCKRWYWEVNRKIFGKWFSKFGLCKTSSTAKRAATIAARKLAGVKK